MSEFVDQWADAMPSIPKERHDVAAQGKVEGRVSYLPKWPQGCIRCDYARRKCDCEGPAAKEPPLTAAHAAALAANIVTAPERLGEKDMVTLPTHYARFAIEPIRFAVENDLNVFQMNILKYIMRHDAKNGLEDLKKARRYLDMFIKYVEGDPDWWRAPK